MSIFRLGFSLVKTNIKAIAAFELLYKLFVTLLFAPALVWLVAFSMRLSGYSYLTDANIGVFLKNPITLLSTVFILCASALITFFEMASLAACMNASYHGVKISTYQMLCLGAQSVKRAFHWKNWPVMVYAMFLTPMVNVAAISGYLSSYRIPDTIAAEIEQHRDILLAALLAAVALYALLVRRMYTLYAFVLDGDDFSSARKESVRILRGGKYLSFWQFFLYSMLIVALELAFTALVGLAGIGVVRVFMGESAGFSVVGTVFLSAFIIAWAVFGLLSMAVTFAYLSALYYRDKRTAGEKPMDFSLPLCKSRPRKHAVILGICLLFVLSTWSFLTVVKNRMLVYAVFEGTAVAAHRGDSFSAPENTLAAFESAIASGASWIELDVKMTKDQVPVVIHDENLLRLTGEDKNVSDLTYAEISALDVGKRLFPLQENAAIPTLSQALLLVKGRIRVIIELKTERAQSALAQTVVEMVREYGMEDECIIMSATYAELRTVKTLAPEIQTAYVVTVAYGRIGMLESADAFCVNVVSVTQTLVNEIHAQGKRIFAWTVNSKKQIESMINLRVDMIITDRPARTIEIASEAALNADVARAVKWLLGRGS